MSVPAGPRWPIEPAERLLADRLGAACGFYSKGSSGGGCRYTFDDGSPRPTGAQLAAATGIDEDVLRKWRDRGLSPWQADRIACRLNVHPCLLWPEYAEWHPLEEQEARAEASRLRRNERNRAYKARRRAEAVA